MKMIDDAVTLNQAQMLGTARLLREIDLGEKDAVVLSQSDASAPVELKRLRTIGRLSSDGFVECLDKNGNVIERRSYE